MELDEFISLSFCIKNIERELHSINSSFINAKLMLALNGANNISNFIYDELKLKSSCVE